MQIQNPQIIVPQTNFNYLEVGKNEIANIIRDIANTLITTGYSHVQCIGNSECKYAYRCHTTYGTHRMISFSKPNQMPVFEFSMNEQAHTGSWGIIVTLTPTFDFTIGFLNRGRRQFSKGELLIQESYQIFQKAVIHFGLMQLIR